MQPQSTRSAPPQPRPPPPHQVVGIHQLQHLGQHLLGAAGHAVDVVAVALRLPSWWGWAVWTGRDGAADILPSSLLASQATKLKLQFNQLVPRLLPVSHPP